MTQKETQIFEPTYEPEEATYTRPQKYLVLINYDIVDNKVRNKIAKYLLGFGQRVQKSSYECYLTQSQYNRLLKGMGPLLEDSQDRLFIYKINTRAEITRFGQRDLPIEDDIIIL